MAQDSFDRTFEAIAKGVWQVFVVLVKLVFRGLRALLQMLLKKGNSSPKARTGGADVSEIGHRWDAANAAAEAGNFRKAIAEADAMIDCGMQSKARIKNSEPESWPFLNFILAQGFFLRFAAKSELMPVITEPDPGESSEDCVKRCEARDAALLPDLEHASEHYEEAIAGKLDHPQMSEEAVREFGAGVWGGIGKLETDPAKAYAAYKRSAELNDDPDSGEDFEVVGGEAWKAGKFADFERFAAKLAARHPRSFALHAGVAEAFWSAGIKIGRDNVAPEEFAERTRLLKEAIRYVAKAMELQPQNPDIVHLQGRIFGALDDVPRLEATLDRLRPLDRANPLPVEVAQRRLHQDSRTEHLESLLESCRRYLARRNT